MFCVDGTFLLSWASHPSQTIILFVSCMGGGGQGRRRWMRQSWIDSTLNQTHNSHSECCSYQILIIDVKKDKNQNWNWMTLNFSKDKCLWVIIRNVLQLFPQFGGEYHTRRLKFWAKDIIYQKENFKYNKIHKQSGWRILLWINRQILSKEVLMRYISLETHRGGGSKENPELIKLHIYLYKKIFTNLL